jgi:hypothetical protein
MGGSEIKIPAVEAGNAYLRTVAMVRLKRLFASAVLWRYRIN